MSKRIQMSAEERGELALRLLRKEATAVELAQEASISEPTLYQWRDAFLRAGYAGLNGRSDRDSERRRHARELAERDQVIGVSDFPCMSLTNKLAYYGDSKSPTQGRKGDEKWQQPLPRNG